MSKNETTNVGNWLLGATKELRGSNIDSARLDALIILEDTLGIGRPHLLAFPEEAISSTKLRTLNAKLSRRINHEPLAYIRGYSEFWEHKFKVTSDVLIPRPESEAFLELLGGLKPIKNQKLIDIGTGSGALAISAKLLCPALDIYAYDNSARAIKIARQNAKKLGAQITFTEKSYADISLSGYDYILANLPYVPVGYPVSPEVNYEPKLAIYAKNGGLELIRDLISKIGKDADEGCVVLLESLAEQQQEVESLCGTAGLDIYQSIGLVQAFVKNK